MPRRSHRRKRKQDPHLNGLIHELKGHVVVNPIDYTKHDYISPGKLRAWAEWRPGILDKEESKCQPQYGR